MTGATGPSSAMPVAEGRLPAAQLLQGRVVGGVRMEGGDRDQALADGVDVGHLVRLPVVAALFDPVVLAAAGIDAFQDGTFVLPTALDGDDRAQGLVRGDVDVQE